MTGDRRDREPRFLSPAGERSWTWLRRHLERAAAFWLGFLFTEDLVAEQILRERARSNRRLRVLPLVVLEPGSPAELAASSTYSRSGPHRRRAAPGSLRPAPAGTGSTPGRRSSVR